MYYPGIDFQTSISIRTIYSIHYYEYRTDFTFSGETHDFWEFVYADKGETIITSDQTEFRLKAGELYFHKPNEFHAVRSDGQIAPNLIVISFDLSVSNKSDLQLSSAKQLFALSDRILRIDQTERRLLALIIQEAKQSFIIGGTNYGQGSSREHAALVPLYLGVKAVVTKSFARIHKSNLINAGILPLTFVNEADYDKIEQGDQLELTGIRDCVISDKPIVLKNITKGLEIPVNSDLSGRSKDILLAGGLLNYTREQAK